MSMKRIKPGRNRAWNRKAKVSAKGFCISLGSSLTGLATCSLTTSTEIDDIVKNLIENPDLMDLMLDTPTFIDKLWFDVELVIAMDEFRKGLLMALSGSRTSASNADAAGWWPVTSCQIPNQARTYKRCHHSLHSAYHQIASSQDLYCDKMLNLETKLIGY